MTVKRWRLSDAQSKHSERFPDEYEEVGHLTSKCWNGSLLSFYLSGFSFRFCPQWFITMLAKKLVWTPKAISMFVKVFTETDDDALVLLIAEKTKAEVKLSINFLVVEPVSICKGQKNWSRKIIH